MQHQNIAIPYASITDNAPTYEITTDLKTKINCLLNNSRSSVNSSANLCGKCALHHIFEPTSCQEIPSTPTAIQASFQETASTSTAIQTSCQGTNTISTAKQTSCQGTSRPGVTATSSAVQSSCPETFSTWCHCYLPQDLIAGPHLI